MEQRHVKLAIVCSSVHSWSVSSVCTALRARCAARTTTSMTFLLTQACPLPCLSMLINKSVGAGAARSAHLYLFKLAVLWTQVCGCGRVCVCVACRGCLGLGVTSASQSSGNVPLFPKLYLFVPLKWASHHIHVLASPEQQRLVGEGSQKQTPYTHTHTTHTARPFSSRPTSAQLCHTIIHLLISAVPPWTAAQLAEQHAGRWRVPSFGEHGGKSHIYSQIDLRASKAMAHISRLPQSQSVSWEEEEKWHILNRCGSSLCFRVHRESGAAQATADIVIVATAGL